MATPKRRDIPLIEIYAPSCCGVEVFIEVLNLYNYCGIENNGREVWYGTIEDLKYFDYSSTRYHYKGKPCSLINLIRWLTRHKFAFENKDHIMIKLNCNVKGSGRHYYPAAVRADEYNMIGKSKVGDTDLDTHLLWLNDHEIYTKGKQ